MTCALSVVVHMLKVFVIVDIWHLPKELERDSTNNTNDKKLHQNSNQNQKEVNYHDKW